MWCNMVHVFREMKHMPPKSKRSSRSKHEPKTLRASVSFPCELYTTIGHIAKEKKVSVAWIIRDATEKYVDEQWPLFEKTK